MRWEKKPLSECCSFVGGYAFKSSELSEVNRGNDIPVVKIGNLTAQGFLDLTKSQYYPYTDKLKQYIINNGDILLAMTGATVGKISISNKNNVYLNQRVGLLRPKDIVLNRKFLFYCLLDEQFYNFCQDTAGGGAQGNISPTQILNYKLPLPPLHIQQHITEVLDKADALRQKDQLLLQKYDELAQSIFYDMFGDPVKNEKSWELKKFKECGTLDRGVSKNRPRNAPELLGGKYPLIQTGDIANSGGYITSYTSSYSELGLKQSKLWKKGTLCITIAANIAKTAVLTFDACFPDSVVGFLPNQFVTTNYIRFWIGYLQKILEDSAPESAQKNINLDILRNLNVPVPPIELQNRFELLLINNNKLKNKCMNSSKKSELLFDSLLDTNFKN